MPITVAPKQTLVDAIARYETRMEGIEVILPEKLPSMQVDRIFGKKIVAEDQEGFLSGKKVTRLQAEKRIPIALCIIFSVSAALSLGAVALFTWWAAIPVVVLTLGALACGGVLAQKKQLDLEHPDIRDKIKGVLSNMNFSDIVDFLDKRNINTKDVVEWKLLGENKDLYKVYMLLFDVYMQAQRDCENVITQFNQEHDEDIRYTKRVGKISSGDTVVDTVAFLTRLELAVNSAYKPLGNRINDAFEGVTRKCDECFTTFKQSQ